MLNNIPMFQDVTNLFHYEDNSEEIAMTTGPDSLQRKDEMPNLIAQR